MGRGFQNLAWPIVVGFVVAASLVGSNDPLVVNTTSGPVRGTWQDGRRVFRGIPYAAPPTGDLRFRAPARHPGWNEVLKATDFGPCCLQFVTGCWSSSNVSSQSEDCLTINLITPSTQSSDPKGYPILLYVHSGEFRCGCSNDAESNWLAFGDSIIFISFNYRIGALGFLGDESLRGRDVHGSTGNYGLLDQRFALQWVQLNALAFGGNPSAVTMMGESSGGTSVAFHLLAAGRGQGQPFKRAILESPGLTQVKTWQDASTNAEFTLANLAASRSPNCSQENEYVAFADNFVMGRAIHFINGSDVPEGKSWCSNSSDCSGFTYQQHQMFFFAGSLSIRDVEATTTSHPQVFMKRGPQNPSARVSCLLSAEAKHLELLTEDVPRDDTFATDGWAPVLDGVTLPASLLDQLEHVKIPEEIDVLVGSNLDEGTEFMGLAPRILCNATEVDLKRWSDEFLGSASTRVLRLYDIKNILRPLPYCQDESYGPIQPPMVPGEQAVYFNAAMRIAGDVSVTCPLRKLALAITAGRIFRYKFKLTPAFSLNFAETKTEGAFHGAEVPFVFGTTAELTNSVEHQLSQTMGCYWGNFVQTGHPSSSSCLDNISWPAYEAHSGILMQFDAEVVSKPEDALESERCKALAPGDARLSIQIHEMIV